MKKEEKNKNGSQTKEQFCLMHEISKNFDAVRAVNEVSFDIRAGEVHALVGENGAGKSTLMKILYGLYPPDDGTILMDGKKVSFNSTREAEMSGIAMIPQELDLFNELSITENLFIGRERPRKWWGGFDWKKMNQQAEKIFETLDISIDVTMQVNYLSTASSQLVEICRALIKDARIVIMDEPTSALSELEADRLFRIINDLKRDGKGVVYISHKLEEIFKISDRVTVMRDGKKILTDSIENLTQNNVVKAMVGRPLSKLYSRKKYKKGKNILKIKNLSIPGVFKNISFTLNEGEVVGLSGLIGAGRTELAQAIFGINPPISGEIYLNDMLIQISNPSEALSLGIAYVPEERRSQGLVLPFTVKRNITLAILKKLSKFGSINGITENQIAKDFVLRLSIGSGKIDGRVNELSGGNQQKVLISKILASEPSILILDEPTRGVDIGAKSEIYRLIDKLAQSGKAILFISSELPELISMSDRILVMREGLLIDEVKNSEATQEKITALAAGAEKEFTE